MDREMRKLIAQASKEATTVETVTILMLSEILEELRLMRQASESDPDAEPDPYQTLNGP